MSKLNSRLVTQQEIADRAGVTRTAVGNWRSRHSDFPAPKNTGRPVRFDMAEIDGWLENHGFVTSGDRTAAAVLGDLLALIERDRGAEAAGSYMLPMAANLLVVLAAGKAVRAAGAKSEAAEGFRAAASVDEMCAAAVEILQALLPAEVTQTLSSQFERSGKLAALSPAISEEIIELRDKILSASDVDFGAAASKTAERLLDAKRLGRTDSYLSGGPSIVSELAMAAFVEQPRSVEDLNTGTGGSLLQLAQWIGREAEVFGVGMNREALAVAGLRAFLSDFHVDFRLGAAVHEKTVSESVDLVLSDGPLAVQLRTKALEESPRDFWGVRGPFASDAARVVDACSRLTPTGEAYVLVPPQLMTASSQAEFRTQLLARGVLRAVVQLPQKSVNYTSLGLCVLVLGPASTQAQDVWLLDASDLRNPVSGTALGAELKRLRSGGGSTSGSLGAGTVALSDLEENTTLLPSEQLAAPPSREETEEARHRSQEAFARAVGQLEEAGFDLDAAESVAGLTDVKQVKLVDLVNEGSVRMVKCHGGSAVDADFEPSAFVFALAKSETDEENRTLRRVETGLSFEPLAGGDIIVPMLGAHRAEVFVDLGIQFALGHSARALRIIDTDQIDATYLTHIINAGFNAARPAASGIPRRSLRDIAVPLPSKSDQTRIAERLDALEEYARQARAAAQSAEKLAATTLNWIPFA